MKIAENVHYCDYEYGLHNSDFWRYTKTYKEIRHLKENFDIQKSK